MTLKVLLDSAALRQLQNITYFLKPIHFFDKIKLILDHLGLSKKKLILMLSILPAFGGSIGLFLGDPLQRCTGQDERVLNLFLNR